MTGQQLLASYYEGNNHYTGIIEECGWHRYHHHHHPGIQDPGITIRSLYSFVFSDEQETY